MSSFKRKQLFVDSKVQGALLLRLMGYWAFSMLTVVTMLLIWRILTGPARVFYTHFDDLWFQYGPAFVASLIILPLLVVDFTRLSNRFAGPLYRLRRSLRDLAAGHVVENIQFRDADFWQEVATEFNAVNERVHQLEKQLAQAQGTTRAAASPAESAANRQTLVLQ